MFEPDLLEIAVLETDLAQFGGDEATGVQVGLVEYGIPAVYTGEIAANQLRAREIAARDVGTGKHHGVKAGSPERAAIQPQEVHEHQAEPAVREAHIPKRRGREDASLDVLPA